ncbi:hypothetical protein [Longimicrobium sp.]|uniref:hypothetical protein n=1 Tax=Longimicrobium sp. TaxID=2029185 RepID=UPI003B3A0BA1
MTRFFRTAAAAAILLLVLAAPAAAQQTVLAAPSWDARLTPPPVATAERAAVRAAALPRPVKGIGFMLLGAGLMYVTKQAEGEDGEEGVPFIPLLSGTMGAMTFWYGVYHLATGEG